MWYASYETESWPCTHKKNLETVLDNRDRNKRTICSQARNKAFTQDPAWGHKPPTPRNSMDSIVIVAHGNQCLVRAQIPPRPHNYNCSSALSNVLSCINVRRWLDFSSKRCCCVFLKMECPWLWCEMINTSSNIILFVISVQKMWLVGDQIPLLWLGSSSTSSLCGAPDLMLACSS